MAAFTNAGYVSPGQFFNVDGVTVPPAVTDTLVVNGRKQTIQEWIRRGVIRQSALAGNIATYHVQSVPDHIGQMAG